MEGISRPTVRRTDPSASTTTLTSPCGSIRSGPPVGGVCVNSDTLPQEGFLLNACSANLVPARRAAVLEAALAACPQPWSATGETLKSAKLHCYMVRATHRERLRLAGEVVDQVDVVVIAGQLATLAHG